MRKDKLTMDELEKYNTIKKLVENNGNKNRAAQKLNCSKRHINRLIKLYKDEGIDGFVHGNRGRAPSIAYPLETRNQIVKLYIDEYSDANLTHFSEIVNKDFEYSISPNTIRNWLLDQNVLSPKARKSTRKTLKKKLESQLEDIHSKKESNSIKETICMIDELDAHPRRSRSKYMGEMIQMDASSFHWIDNQIWHLHVAIDDATGCIVGAWFDTQETLNGYYHVLYQILHDYGIPALFYTDRRTVFEYKRKNSLMDDDDTFTQFSYACHQLGIEIKTTSVAQAKGRVERLNQTLQSRVPVELRRANIKTIDQANEFLKSYLKKFNDQFSLQLNSTKNVFEQQPEEEKIFQILSVLTERKIDSGHCIRFKNRYYIPTDKNGKRAFYLKGTECLVIEAFDKNIYISIKDQIYAAEHIKDHEEFSREFDEPVPEKKKKPKYIPPANSPWRLFTFSKYRNSMPHRQADRCFL